ncbi:LysR family transcriptional regulator [Ornithinimicrobium avium]|uniref:LysR family transcriptional regulator n=1 Tax=Ornithinimicrobium avium TaxID=2283195 RepID=A0A345NL21_9MICO|nr:LysR family transcriptional regulator [Ornithinimicrobium avium]AXH95729.1 LysR family transcriptional regulator [Ornithinimicrobium avium]
MTLDRWPDLAVIELLVGVEEHGSIGAAAAAVGMAQPNASRALQRLERRSGVPLLLRSTRGTVLTPEAALVVDWGREVLAAAERLTASMAALGTTRASRLKVAASQTVAEYLLPGWLADYRERPRAVEVQLEVGNSVQVTAAVVEGRADLGFVETSHLGRGVRSRRVGTDHLVVVVAPGHSWARRRSPLDAARLAGTALVVREDGSGTRDALEHALARHDLAVAEPAQALGSNAAVRVAAMAGVAPAVLSEHAVREALDSGRLVRVPVDGVDLSRPLRAVWRDGARPPEAAGDLLGAVRGDEPARAAVR